MRFATSLVHFDPAPGDPSAPAITPIYQTATFRQPSATEAGRFDYSRSANPTREVLEAQLARLEAGARGLAYASGMAAVDAALSLIPAGGAVIAGRDLYGGTYRFLHTVAATRGVYVRFADTACGPSLEAALGEVVAAGHAPILVWVETPSNPLMHITDLRQAARLAHRHGAWLAVDNSLMSPYLQRPLTLGADLVAHSATKFLSGHGQVTAGALVVRERALGKRLAAHQNAAGTALAPFDSWLVINGLKTLALRLGRQQTTARRLCALLASRPEVRSVFYPGREQHPGARVHAHQASGPGSVLSVRLASPALGRALVDGTELFGVAVSFGSVGSTLELPGRMSHAPLANTETAHDDTLVRLSIGIEDAEDLAADVTEALDAARLQHDPDPDELARIGGVHPSKPDIKDRR